MKITTISLTKTIAMPGYNNDKPAVVEAILEEGDTMEDCLSALNKRLTAWHQKEYPWLYTIPSMATPAGMGDNPYTNAGVSPSIAGPFTLPTIDKSIERLEIQIDNAKTVEELHMCLEEAMKTPNGIKAYMNKLKELSA